MEFYSQSVSLRSHLLSNRASRRSFLHEGAYDVLQTLNHWERKLFEVLASGSRRYRNYYPSHQTLASIIGKSLRQTRRYLRVLIDKGLILSRRRGFNRSCLYRLSTQYFRDAFWHAYNVGRWALRSVKDRATRLFKKNGSLFNVSDNNISLTTKNIGSLPPERDPKKERDSRRAYQELEFARKRQRERESSLNDVLGFLAQNGLD